ncbi:PIN domain-containing protein [Iningainema tapete]|nr:PIN domain-containing protein [Iningainema tapete]
MKVLLDTNVIVDVALERYPQSTRFPSGDASNYYSHFASSRVN